MNKALLIIVLLIGGIFLTRFIFGAKPSIPKTSDKKVQEKIDQPKPTESQGQNLVQAEICKAPSGKEMNVIVARQLAFDNCKEGQLGEGYSCNEETGAWEFDFAPLETKKDCNPACIVNVETQGVEINWRCTSLNPK